MCKAAVVGRGAQSILKLQPHIRKSPWVKVCDALWRKGLLILDQEERKNNQHVLYSDGSLTVSPKQPSVEHLPTSHQVLPLGLRNTANFIMKIFTFFSFTHQRKHFFWTDFFWKYSYLILDGWSCSLSSLTHHCHLLCSVCFEYH